MNTPSLATRLISVAAACGITAALLSAAVSIGAPQQERLLAKSQRAVPAVSTIRLATVAAPMRH